MCVILNAVASNPSAAKDTLDDIITHANSSPATVKTAMNNGNYQEATNEEVLQAGQDATNAKGSDDVVKGSEAEIDAEAKKHKEDTSEKEPEKTTEKPKNNGR